MNEVIKNMLTRTSVRKFSAQKIDADTLKTIVECAKASPTAKNRQARKFTVVHNKEKIDALAAAIAKELDRSNYNFYNCDAIIIISYEKGDEHGFCDSSVAMQNIYLAAHALGLGSVWINQLKNNCDRKTIREVLNTLHIPQNHEVCGFSALGYPAETPEIKERTEPVEFIN